MAVPVIASEICALYQAALDASQPGLLAGLYLVGSIALDDFQAGRSDIDFVAVTTRPVDVGDVAPIHAALARAHRRPFFDGVYVTAEELRALPDGRGSGVAVIEGVPSGDSRAERQPVTWLTLFRHGVTLRGPAPADLAIAADPAAARIYSRRNLAEYWQPWIVSHRRLFSLGGGHGLTAEAVAWSVLGLSRLHALIVAGGVMSKTGAGLYAREIFPQHRVVIDCALAHRRGERALFLGGPFQRRRAMLAYLDAAMADILARSGS